MISKIKKIFLILILTQFIACSTYKDIDEILNPVSFDTNNVLKQQIKPTVSSTNNILKEEIQPTVSNTKKVLIQQIEPTISDTNNILKKEVQPTVYSTNKVLIQKIEPTTSEIKNIIITQVMPETMRTNKSIKNLSLEVNYFMSALYTNLLNVQSTNLKILDKIAGSDEKMKKEINTAVENLATKQIIAINYQYSLSTKMLDEHRKEISHDINKLKKNTDKNIKKINHLENKMKNMDIVEKKKTSAYVKDVKSFVKRMDSNDQRTEKLLKELKEIKELEETKLNDEANKRIKELPRTIQNIYKLEVNIGALWNSGGQENFKFGGHNN